MADPLFATAVTCSAMCCLGIWLVAVALWPAEVRLADAFAMLDDQAPRRETELGPQLVTDRDSRLEHTGAWLYQHARLPITDTTARLLMLQGRSIGDYLIHKLLLAAVGLFAPILLALGLAGQTARGWGRTHRSPALQPVACAVGARRLAQPPQNPCCGLPHCLYRQLQPR